MTDSYPYHYLTYATSDGGSERLPCKHCAPGLPCAEARGVFDPVPGSDATMFIQWKGTDVCLDFHCPCQPERLKFSAHFDGFSAYAVRCPACGSVYELGTQVRARLIDSDDRDSVVDLDPSTGPAPCPPSTRPTGPAVPDVLAAARAVAQARSIAALDPERTTDSLVHGASAIAEAVARLAEAITAYDAMVGR